ncbi:hypothetical protein ACQ4PT_057968 [Festuca glaucescens]
MADDGGDEMALHTSPTVPPLEDDDLLSEILLRLPPLPSSLPRASLVSKHWGRLAASAAFRRRVPAHHRKPPVLGLFHNPAGELLFTPALAPPDRIPRERFSLYPGGDGSYPDPFDCWSLLACRHGRVLIASSWWRLLLVFDPVSGDRRRVAVPPDFVDYMFTANGAMLCAAGGASGAAGHVHGDCLSSPFKVVLVSTRWRQRPAVARVYSSETGLWGDLVEAAEPCAGMVSRLPGTLVGNSLYWWLNESDDGMLEFDLDTRTLAVVKRPPFEGVHGTRIRIIKADEDGGVGLAVLSYPSFQIWRRRVDSCGVATWVLHATVRMDKILGLPSEIEAGRAAIRGYAEDADAVFISVNNTDCRNYFFVVQLDSMQSTELCGNFLGNSYHPFTNFYTGGPSMCQLPAPANYVQGPDGAADDSDRSLMCSCDLS